MTFNASGSNTQYISHDVPSPRNNPLITQKIYFSFVLVTLPDNFAQTKNSLAWYVCYRYLYLMQIGKAKTTYVNV